MSKILHKQKMFTDQLHVWLPATIAFEEGSMVGLPTFESLVLALCQGKLCINITEPADSELCRFDYQRWGPVPIQRDIPTANDGHGFIFSFVRSE